MKTHNDIFYVWQFYIQSLLLIPSSSCWFGHRCFMWWSQWPRRLRPELASAAGSEFRLRTWIHVWVLFWVGCVEGEAVRGTKHRLRNLPNVCKRHYSAGFWRWCVTSELIEFIELFHRMYWYFTHHGSGTGSFCKENVNDYSVVSFCLGGHAVAQLVEALRHKPEGRGFHSRLC
jgi:hypothetical protein